MIASQGAAPTRCENKKDAKIPQSLSELLQHTPKLPIAPDWALRSI
jgi:hypothetical protein